MHSQLCGAKCRDGRPCTQRAMANGRCRMHGGKSTGAPLIHGRYSKHLKGDLLARYERSRNDPDLLSLREEVSVLDALISEIVDEIERDPHGSKVRLRVIIKEKSDLVLAETRRIKEIGAILTAEEAAALVAALSSAVADEVTDPEVLRRINEKFVRAIGPVPR